MFRYLTFAWDRADQGAKAVADRRIQKLRHDTAWQTVLEEHGLIVFVRGDRPGVNGSTPVPEGQGAILGRIFRRDELDKPGQPSLILTQHEAAAIVASSGRALIRDYWGRYVAFWRDNQGAPWVLRDPSGTLPCFIARDDRVTLVFSWLEDALEIWPVSAGWTVDERSLRNIVRGEPLSGRLTGLTGVRQVLPAETLPLLHPEDPGALLWSPVEQARLPPVDDLDEAAAALHRTTTAVARAWAACYGHVLFRLSGGVDSSILLSCLARGATRARITCLNYHSAGVDSDERHFARLAAERCGFELLERERLAHFDLSTILKAARMPTPTPHVGRMGSARQDADLARALGAEVLFTGGGGDQLFFEFHQCWPVADYLRLRGIDRGLVAALLDAARLGRVSIWAAARQAIADRLARSTLASEPTMPLSFLGEAARGAPPADPVYVHPEAAAAATLPIGKRMQALQLLFPLGYYDPFEREAAPELLNPLLSQPLIELCLRTPTYVLNQGGQARGLARRAFVNDLPSEIIHRRSKGGLSGHLHHVLLANLDFVRGQLLEGELVCRGLLDRTRLEAVLQGPPEGMASHAGEIHSHLATEAWLASRCLASRPATT
jgi:asparagine synthase (glutamine-hydrolysing)